MTREELRKRYGAFVKAPDEPLDPSKVPPALRVLIPYAEIWGTSDDTDRDELVDSAPLLARRDLAAAVDSFRRELNEWLAGPEADSRHFSREYLAFTHLRMARDYS